MRRLLLRRAKEEDTHISDNESNTRTPRWVKVFGIIAFVLVLLFVILQLTGGVHGPGRHTQSEGSKDPTPPIELGIQKL